MQRLITLANRLIDGLNLSGTYLSLVGIRFLLAWEFWDSGVEKFNGDNWFDDIKSSFPFPFNLIPTNISWFISTWFELLGAIALVLGLGSRFTAFSLIILDVVAWVSVHADNGYNVCSNGFKLPLIYLLMFIPILLSGAGRLSLDYYIKQWFERKYA